MFGRQNGLAHRHSDLSSSKCTSRSKFAIDSMKFAIAFIADAILRCTSTGRSKRKFFSDQIFVFRIVYYMLFHHGIVVVTTIVHLQHFIRLDCDPNRCNGIACYMIFPKNDRCSIDGSFSRESTRLTHLGLRHDQRFSTTNANQILVRRCIDTMNQEIAVDQMRNGIAVDICFQANQNSEFFKLTRRENFTSCHIGSKIVLFVCNDSTSQFITQRFCSLFNLVRLHTRIKLYMHDLFNSRITFTRLNQRVYRNTQSE